MTEHQAPAERLSDEKLSEILAGCKGVTPGPWETGTTRSEGSYGNGEDTHEGFDAYELIGPPQYPGGRDVVICDTLNSDASSIEEDFDEETHSAWDEQGRKNFAYLARLDPQTVAALVTELLAARSQLAETREALKPFAESAEHIPASEADFKVIAVVPAGLHAEVFRKLRDRLTAGDFRRARAALSTPSSGASNG